MDCRCSGTTPTSPIPIAIRKPAHCPVTGRMACISPAVIGIRRLVCSRAAGARIFLELLACAPEGTLERIYWSPDAGFVSSGMICGRLTGPAAIGEAPTTAKSTCWPTFQWRLSSRRGHQPLPDPVLAMFEAGRRQVFVPIRRTALVAHARGELSAALLIEDRILVTRTRAGLPAAGDRGRRCLADGRTSRWRAPSCWQSTPTGTSHRSLTVGEVCRPLSGQAAPADGLATASSLIDGGRLEVVTRSGSSLHHRWQIAGHSGWSPDEAVESRTYCSVPEASLHRRLG